MRKTIIRVLKIIGYSIAALACIFVTFIIIGRIITFVHRNDWKERTTPLPQSTVHMLCANFDLDETNKLCNGREVIYGPDFYKIIVESFRPYEWKGSKEDAASYDEVERKIGQFKYDCESVVTEGDGFSYFVCYYDLRGDREFIIGNFFSYPDNLVYRINFPWGED